MLISTTLERAVELLTGIALIGAGIAVARDGHVLVGVSNIGVAVAFIGLGVAVLRDGRVLAGITSIGGGVAVLLDDYVLAGVAVLGGVASIGFGIAIIGYRIVILGRTGIVARALTWLAALTTDLSSEAR